MNAKNTDYFSLFSFMFRENRVPYYQRLFQNHDGKRQWWKVSSRHNGIHTPSIFSSKQLTVQLFRRPPAPATSCTPTSSPSTASVLVSLFVDMEESRPAILTEIATTYAMGRMVFVSFFLPRTICYDSRAFLYSTSSHADFFPGPQDLDLKYRSQSLCK